MRDRWVWFMAGGFTGLALARALARWWRRLFWLTATALFGAGALLLMDPTVEPGTLLKAAQRAALATSRALVGGYDHVP